MLASFISLLFGFLIGYMAQRSRMCFIGGMRDFILVRDTSLLRGLISFLLTAAVLFPLAGALGGSTPGYPWYAEAKSKAVLELARDYWAFAACFIPDDVLLAAQKAAADAVRGMTLPGGLVLSYTALAAITGGLGIGYLSTVANGCPLRQHVLAASGNKSARTYLLGFYSGAIIYTYLLLPYFGKYLP
jgi:uncharacterized protein